MRARVCHPSNLLPTTENAFLSNGCQFFSFGKRRAKAFTLKTKWFGRLSRALLKFKAGNSPNYFQMGIKKVGKDSKKAAYLFQRSLYTIHSISNFSTDCQLRAAQAAIMALKG
ncbi:MAG: hypothetical protein D6816_09595, partial [Bacteroidetes bacterium]